MSTPRRLAVLCLAAGLVAAVGCGSASPPPAPEPPAPAAPAADTLPAGDGSLIRASKDAAPPRKSEPPAPKPGDIVLPDGGGAWPWPLAPAPPAGPSRPVAIPEYLAPGAVTGVVASPAARRAVVLIAERVKGQERATRVLWCDLAAGTVVSEWRVKGVYTPLDLHPDGRRVLAVRSPGEGRTDHLELWTIAEPNKLRQQPWQPHDTVRAAPGELLAVGGEGDPARPDPGRDVRWAAFAGGNRIASASRAGQVRVFDADTLKRIGTIDAVPATPALTPDGSKVVFLTPAGAALLDPADAKVLGVRSVGTPPADPVLAVSPDGKALACAGKEAVTLLDLTGGSVRTTAAPKLEVARPGFGWAGDRHLLAGRLLYDPARAEPVWDYGGAEKLVPCGREVWAVLRRGDEEAVLRSFALPHPAVGTGDKPGRSVLTPDGITDAAK